MSKAKWTQETRMKHLAASKLRQQAQARKAATTQIQPAASLPAPSQASEVRATAPQTSRRASDTTKTAKTPQRDAVAGSTKPQDQPASGGTSQGLALVGGDGEVVRSIRNPEGRNQFSSEMAGLPYSSKYHMAVAMLQAGKTYADVHAVTGLASSTIAKLKSGEIEINRNVCEAIRKGEVDKLTRLTDEALDLAFGQDCIKRASFSQLMVGYGIMTEKRELLAGRPTQRSEFVGQKASDLDSEAARLEAEIQSLRAGAVDAQIVEAGSQGAKS